MALDTSRDAFDRAEHHFSDKYNIGLDDSDKKDAKLNKCPKLACKAYKLTQRPVKSVYAKSTNQTDPRFGTAFEF